MTSNTDVVLEAHRANLANSKTFEEYRDHHVAYIDFLIERERAKNAVKQAEVRFVYRSVETGAAEIVTTKDTPDPISND
jgi:hypothetical protein